MHGQVSEATAVSPLVVVPTEHLHHGPTVARSHAHREVGIKDATVRVTHHVARHDRVCAIFQHTAQRAVGRRCERGFNFFD